MVGFILTYLFGFTKKQTSTETAETIDKIATSNHDEIIFSPFHGVVKPLQNIDDAAFASGALGEGVAIEPLEEKLFSPVSGTISTLFPTVLCKEAPQNEGSLLPIFISHLKLVFHTFTFLRKESFVGKQ